MVVPIMLATATRRIEPARVAEMSVIRSEVIVEN